jgi:ribosomal protein S6--L-glutamate ligase
MHIGILSRNATLYSTRRLVAAARAQNHQVDVIDTMTVAGRIGLPTTGRISLINPAYRSARLLSRHWPLHRSDSGHMPEVTAIIPRIGASITHFGVAVVRHFENLEVMTTATADGIFNSRDKLRSLQVMNKAGLPVPRTAVVTHRDTMGDVLVEMGTPVIIKLLQSTQGRGVFLAPNLSTALAVLEKLQQYKRQALVQEFISEAAGEDIRIIVVGGRCVAAMRRTAAVGEFRSNLHRGGTAVAIAPSLTMKQLALSAASAHGLAVAGVDLIMSNRGPLLLEVNSSPGLEGIEQATQIDVAGEIIHYLSQLK